VTATHAALFVVVATQGPEYPLCFAESSQRANPAEARALRMIDLDPHRRGALEDAAQGTARPDEKELLPRTPYR
jgi:hypothetical protein